MSHFHCTVQFFVVSIKATFYYFEDYWLGQLRQASTCENIKENIFCKYKFVRAQIAVQLLLVIQHVDNMQAHHGDDEA